MPVRAAGWNEEAVAGGKRETRTVEVDGQRSGQHVSDVPDLAPVDEALAGGEFHQSKLTGSFTEHFRANARASLLPRHRVEIDLEAVHRGANYMPRRGCILRPAPLIRSAAGFQVHSRRP